MLFFSLNPLESVQLKEGTQLRKEDSHYFMQLIFIGFMLLSILNPQSSILNPQFYGFMCLK
jgi:hypothetical protein